MEFSNTFDTLLNEYNSLSPEQRRINQREMRRKILGQVSEMRDGRAVVSVFLSHFGKEQISDAEADVIEEVLINSNCSKGISLLLDAPGGHGLAAERIIHIFRNYSEADFEVIVPGRAKSAATMICLGSDQILMGPAAELGPIDPQCLRSYRDEEYWVPAYQVVESYRLLFEGAKKEEGHGKAPFLEKLHDFDPVEIERLKSAENLGKHIAISSLLQGMMSEVEPEEIEERIEIFTNPEYTYHHGRRIDSNQAIQCGLKVIPMDRDSDLWKAVWSLYLRSKWLVDREKRGGNLIETMDEDKFYLK